MKLRFIFAAVVSALYTSFAPFITHGAVDPEIEWRTLMTPHFDIIYDASQQQVAEAFAQASEAAFHQLVPIFKEYPEKTIVWLNDTTDLANGSAAPIPYPFIIAYSAIPANLDTIGEYGSWSYDLMVHEYTHILSFEPAHGIMAPLRYIFGRLLSPNALLPRWYLEGISVETETRFGQSGRLRSLYQDGLLRGLALDGRFRHEPLARINETSITSWPQGSRPYLMGSLIWNRLTQEGGGDRALYDLVQRYSRRIPYLIHAPAEDLTKMDYNELLADIYAKILRRAQEDQKQVGAEPPSTGTLLPQEGFDSHSPAMSPDGRRLAFVGQTHNHGLYLQVLERPTLATSFADPQLKPKVLHTGRGGHKVSWFPGGESLVFDDVNTHADYYYHSDLYLYDFKQQKSRQITHGQRAREPAVSEDGKFIYFVQLIPGSTQLARVDSEGKNLEVVWTPPLGTRLSRPEALGTERVLFLRRDERGQESLVSLDLKSKALTQHLTDLHPIKNLQRTHDGFLISSGKNGLLNLYHSDFQLAQAHPMTNSPSGAVSGTIDPHRQELLLSQFRGQGLMLHAQPLSEKSPHPKTLVKVEPVTTVEPPRVLTQNPLTLTSQQTPYQPARYLIPRYWMPFLYPIEGGVLITAQTAAADPIGRHSYNLMGGYNTYIERPSLAFSYAQSRGLRTLGLSVTDDYYAITGNGGLLHDANGLVSWSNRIPAWGEKWTGQIAWSYRQTSDNAASVERHGPRLTLSYSDLEQKGDEISPEKGGTAALSVTHYFTVGQDKTYDQLLLSGSKFFSAFLPRRHVLMISGNASAANSSYYLVGATNRGVNYSSSEIRSTFLVRGYPSGTFVGRHMIATGLEYRLPVAYPNWGWGSLPGFLRRLHLSLFSDQVQQEGYYYSLAAGGKKETYLGEIFASVGAELNAELTLFYHYPASLRLGMYYGLNSDAHGGEWIPFIGIGL